MTFTFEEYCDLKGYGTLDHNETSFYGCTSFVIFLNSEPNEQCILGFENRSVND